MNSVVARCEYKVWRLMCECSTNNDQPHDAAGENCGESFCSLAIETLTAFISLHHARTGGEHRAAAQQRSVARVDFTI